MSLLKFIIYLDLFFDFVGKETIALSNETYKICKAGNKRVKKSGYLHIDRIGNLILLLR